MKRYTKHVKNFDKQFNGMFDSMSTMFENMSPMFECFNTSTITEQENKTIIKKGNKTIVINNDGSITVDGKEVEEKCTSVTDDDTNKNKNGTTPVNNENLKLLLHNIENKFINTYWYIVLVALMTCSLSVIISVAICQ